MLKSWDDLPEFMRCDEVRAYYDVLTGKRGQLYIKRLFDIVMSIILIVLLSIPMLIISVIIKKDSRGNVIFCQERVTSYGKVFKIHKFRTMVEEAPQRGALITSDEDSRITKVGKALRKYRLDELPQLFDILVGNMSFVGTRAEVIKYVKCYSNEMYATLLMPAGLTSEASIRFKDEAQLISDVDNVDEVYVNRILPQKMEINLDFLKRFNVIMDLAVMVRTVVAVIK